MCFIANALEQEESVTVTRQNDGVVGIRQPDLLEALGNAAELDVGDPRCIQRPLCRGDLGLAAIDDEQVRAIGELLDRLVVVCGTGRFLLDVA